MSRFRPVLTNPACLQHRIFISALWACLSYYTSIRSLSRDLPCSLRRGKSHSKMGEKKSVFEELANTDGPTHPQFPPHRREIQNRCHCYAHPQQRFFFAHFLPQLLAGSAKTSTRLWTDMHCVTSTMSQLHWRSSGIFSAKSKMDILGCRDYNNFTTDYA